MAEGNGENAKISGRLAGQEFSFATGNPLILVMVLLIVGGIVGGVLIWLQLDKRLDTAGEILVQRLDALHAHHAKLHEMLSANREGTHAEIERVLKALSILSYNMDRAPEDRIPLGINGLPSPKPSAP